MIKYLTFGFLIISVLINCSSQKYSMCKDKKVKQGVAGRVIEISGNVMPSPDMPANNETGTAYPSTVLIYELTNHNDLKQKDGVYTSVSSKKMAESATNKKGEFKIALPEGTYSLFIKLNNGYFANLFDEKMNIHPIAVTKDAITTTIVKVNLKAVY